MTAPTVTQDIDYFQHRQEKMDIPGIFYGLHIKGDTDFRIKGDTARKGGVKAEFTSSGWVFEKKEGAEAVAKRFTKGKRVISVVKSYSPQLINVWHGTQKEAKLAKTKIHQEIERNKNSEKREQIILECHKRGLCYSWLYSDSLDEDMSEKDKETHQLYKPLWDAILEEEEALELRDYDIKCSEEDIKEAGEIPDFVINFNHKHAVVHLNKTYILTEKYDPTLERPTIGLESLSSFKDWNLNKTDEKGDQVSKQWLAHPKRRQYPGGIIFDPKKPHHYDGYYNLFHGFNVKPKQGDCSLFWKLLDVLSGDDKRIATYIRRWLAHMIQRPWEIPEVALAFKGEQGTGKGTFGKYLSLLVMEYYFETASMKEVVGNFNYHLKDLLLVYANEAVWGGHKSEIGSLKAMITDPNQSIEQKGVDLIMVKNCKRWIFSSNEDWVVPLDIDDRRFVVSVVSPRIKGDLAFFEALKKQMDNGGLDALMHDLVHEDIRNWHPRNDKPPSAGTFDLKIRSMKTPHLWLYECLRNGRYTLEPMGEEDWGDRPTELLKDKLYKDYKEACRDWKKEPEANAYFWKQVVEILGGLEKSRRRDPINEGKRINNITLPPLDKARTSFAVFSKEEMDTLWDL